MWLVELNLSGSSQRTAVWLTMSRSQESSVRKLILWTLFMLKEYHLDIDHFNGCCCLHSQNCFCSVPSFEIQVTQSMLFLCPKRSPAFEKCLLILNSNLWQCWADGEEEQSQLEKKKRSTQRKALFRKVEVALLFSSWNFPVSRLLDDVICLWAY